MAKRDPYAVLISKKKERLEVAVTSAVTSSSMLMMFEVFGPSISTEAIRARFAAKRSTRNSRSSYTRVPLGITLRGSASCDQSLGICGQSRYFPIREFKGTDCRLLMLHQDFSRMSQSMLLGGDKHTPSPWFANAIARINVPILSDWLPAIWCRALESSMLIRECQTMVGDVKCFNVDQDASRWQTLVSEMVQDKSLKIPRNTKKKAKKA